MGAGHAKDRRHEDSSLGGGTENLSVGRSRSAGRASDKAERFEFKPGDKGETPKHNDQIHSQRLLPPTVPTVPTAHRAESGFDGVEAADSGARALWGKPVVL